MIISYDGYITLARAALRHYLRQRYAIDAPYGDAPLRYSKIRWLPYGVMPARYYGTYATTPLMFITLIEILRHYYDTLPATP